MDASDVEHLVEESGEIEVLVGINQDSDQDANHLDLYLGEDGEIVNDPGFGIYRVRMTTTVLNELIQTEPAWIDYIEGTEVTR